MLWPLELFVALYLFWGLNGWFQGFGWPPARACWHIGILREPAALGGAFRMLHDIWRCSIPVVAAFCIECFNWRVAMYLPGVICIIMGFWLMERLRDTPAALGLPSAEGIDRG